MPQKVSNCKCHSFIFLFTRQYWFLCSFYSVYFISLLKALKPELYLTKPLNVETKSQETCLLLEVNIQHRSPWKISVTIHTTVKAVMLLLVTSSNPGPLSGCFSHRNEGWMANFLL